MTPGFSTYVLLALLTGTLIGGGLLLFIVALIGLRPKHSQGESLSETMHRVGVFLSTRGALAVIIGLLVLVLSRLIVLSAAAAVLVLAWDALLGGAAGEQGSMERLDALASWTESLRDTIAGAVGLEQAIPASVRAAGPRLQGPLRLMIDRLRTRTPLPVALRRFADDLDDPSADLVVAALILNARLRGPGLRDLLGALSTSAREELDMRRRVEADRRSVRRSVLIVICVTVGSAALLFLLDPDYVKAYSSFVGECVLLLVVLLFAAGFVWLKRLSQFDLPGRLLEPLPTYRVDPGAQPVQAAPAALSAAPRAGAS